MARYSQDLSRLRDTVRDIVNQPANSKALTTSTIDRFLNIAQLEIAKHTELLTANENPSIVADQANYDLPDDWLKTILVQYQVAPAGTGEFMNLDPISREEYLSIWTITTTSRPTHYAIFDGDIHIYPTPTSSSDEYRHFYVEQPEELALTTDIPFNGNNRFFSYHQEVADLAVNLVRARDNGQTSQQAIQAFISRMETMRLKLGTKRKPGAGQVKRRWGRGHRGGRFLRFPSNYGGSCW